MTIAEYLEAVKDRLVFEPQIRSFQIIRDRATAADQKIRIRSLNPVAPAQIEIFGSAFIIFGQHRPIRKTAKQGF